MTNPYESPQSPPGSTDPAPVTGQSVGMFILGFFSALLMTIFLGAIIGFPVSTVLAAQLPKSLEIVANFLSSPAVTGPVCSVILWLRNRNRNRAFAIGAFAIGAVAFGVAAFVLVGGCFMAFSL